MAVAIAYVNGALDIHHQIAYFPSFSTSVNKSANLGNVYVMGTSMSRNDANASGLHLQVKNLAEFP